MPHCIIEYSKSLENQLVPDDILQAVHNGTVASRLFSLADIKVRAIPYTWHYLAADTQDFIHVTVKILAGRTLEQKQILSKSILQALSVMSLSSISLTVEVCDIDAPSYSKLVLN